MDRYHQIAKCADIWMNLREQNTTINQYFEVRNIRKVGIYGYGILGRHLVWEIEQSDGYSNVLWILDKRAEQLTATLYPTYFPKEIETLEEPDVIVVCAVHDFEEVEAFLSQRIRVPVESLETIIRECESKMRMEYEL